MKSITLNIALIFAVVITYSSCSLFEDLDDVSFDTEVPVEFFINETEENPAGKAYSATEFLDLTSDPDVEEYASKIKDIKVNKITYFIYGVSDPGVNLSGGSLMISSTNKTIATLANQGIIESASGELSIDSEGFKELSTRLKNNKSETIKLQGNLSETPISFAVEFVFYVTVTADALK